MISLQLTYIIYYLLCIFSKASFLLYIYTLQVYDYLMSIILSLINIIHKFLTLHILSINACQIYSNLRNSHLLSHKIHITYYFLLLLVEILILLIICFELLVFQKFSNDCFKNLFYQNSIILFPFKGL